MYKKYFNTPHSKTNNQTNNKATNSQEQIGHWTNLSAENEK